MTKSPKIFTNATVRPGGADRKISGFFYDFPYCYDDLDDQFYDNQLQLQGASIASRRSLVLLVLRCANGLSDSFYPGTECSQKNSAIW